MMERERFGVEEVVSGGLAPCPSWHSDMDTAERSDSTSSNSYGEAGQAQRLGAHAHAEYDLSPALTTKR